MITPPDASKSLPQMGLSPKRRDCESSGWPLLKFSVHTGCTCHTALGERPALRTCAGLLIHSVTNRRNNSLLRREHMRIDIGPD